MLWSLHNQWYKFYHVEPECHFWHYYSLNIQTHKKKAKSSSSQETCFCMPYGVSLYLRIFIMIASTSKASFISCQQSFTKKDGSFDPSLWHMCPLKAGDSVTVLIWCCEPPFRSMMWIILSTFIQSLFTVYWTFFFFNLKRVSYQWYINKSL